MTNDKRNFVLRQSDDDENGVFTGNTPRQAAVKAARRIVDPSDNEEHAEDNPTEIKLRERGTDDVHVYDAWTWNEEAPEDKPEWLPEEITEANVAKKGVENADD